MPGQAKWKTKIKVKLVNTKRTIAYARKGESQSSHFRAYAVVVSVLAGYVVLFSRDQTTRTGITTAGEAESETRDSWDPRLSTTPKASTACYEDNLTPWPESASELYWPSDRRLSAKLVPTFVDRGCHVVSVTYLYGRILNFLDRSHYFFFQVAPELYSRGWMDPAEWHLSCSEDTKFEQTPGPPCSADSFQRVQIPDQSLCSSRTNGLSEHASRGIPLKWVSYEMKVENLGKRAVHNIGCSNSNT
jgi:hypothetical protein